jgi:hypothetical protein
MKRILQFALLAFVVAALASWSWERIRAAPSEQAKVLADDSTLPGGTAVLITYFTTDARCESCRQIETLTLATVNERFRDEQAMGMVRFRAINLDRRENSRFAQEFQLSFKTVVIETFRNRERLSWEKMDDVWKHVADPGAFKAYLEAPVRKGLSTSG